MEENSLQLRFHEHKYSFNDATPSISNRSPMGKVTSFKKMAKRDSDK